jgi:transposase
MKVENIDIQATIEKARLLVSEDKQLSAATKSVFEMMILIITLLANRLNLNSSKPPSSGPNRKMTGKKAGGQKGHKGYQQKMILPSTTWMKHPGFSQEHSSGSG